MWRAILVARDLPVYLDQNVYLEPYSPNQFARQFGLTQCIPVPFYQTLNKPWDKKDPKSVKQFSLEGRRSYIYTILQKLFK